MMVAMSTTPGEIEEICNAFEKYYWKSRQVSYSGMPGAYLQKVPKEDAGLPLLDLVAYVMDAWKSKLEKGEACSYGGTKFLYAVLGRTNRRWTHSLEEANELWRLGRKVSEYLWGLLEKHGYGKEFREEVDLLVPELQKCFEKVIR